MDRRQYFEDRVVRQWLGRYRIFIGLIRLIGLFYASCVSRLTPPKTNISGRKARQLRTFPYLSVFKLVPLNFFINESKNIGIARLKNIDPNILNMQ